jgi:hypothetical protein
MSTVFILKQKIIKTEKMDLSIERRRYFGNEPNIKYCPECGLELVRDGCTILICTSTENGDNESLTNISGSYFCSKCPVVVFSELDLNHSAKMCAGFYTKRLKYIVAGIVNFNAIPKDKKDDQLGTIDNPLPLVKFLPDKASPRIIAEKKTGRNDLCNCGSGLKYKKCCGK